MVVVTALSVVVEDTMVAVFVRWRHWWRSQRTGWARWYRCLMGTTVLLMHAHY